MALECRGGCHAARRVSSSHECIMECDRQGRCRTGNGVSFVLGVDEGRSKAGSASGLRKDDVG